MEPALVFGGMGCMWLIPPGIALMKMAFTVAA